jgi:hypothetical protein
MAVNEGGIQKFDLKRLNAIYLLQIQNHMTIKNTNTTCHLLIATRVSHIDPSHQVELGVGRISIPGAGRIAQ